MVGSINSTAGRLDADGCKLDEIGELGKSKTGCQSPVESCSLRASNLATRQVEKTASRYDSKSVMTFPLLAIFMGRPFRLVNVVSNEIPSDLQIVAIKSSDE
jgi:hypothetical protein